MAGMGSDIVADVAIDAAIEGFMTAGLIKGSALTATTAVCAGAMTIVAMAVPMIAVAGVAWLISEALSESESSGGTPPNGQGNAGTSAA